MPKPPLDITSRLLERIAEVRRRLGLHHSSAPAADSRFGDLLGSMAMVEFLCLVADDCGVSPTAVEECVERRFSTVAELAAGMMRAGFQLRFSGDAPVAAHPDHSRHAGAAPRATAKNMHGPVWIAGVTVRLPQESQTASELDSLLHRPPGWLEQHAGIRLRRIWAAEDAIQAAAECGQICMDQCGISPDKIGALLVTSEAPPRPAGLAADLHYRLGLESSVPALEIGGACTGFLAALEVGRALAARIDIVLILSLEAPSRYLQVRPGSAGEAAALFGDGAAAAALTPDSVGASSFSLDDIMLTCHGEAADLIRVEPADAGGIEVRMEGPALAARAVRAMSSRVLDLATRNGLPVDELETVIVHGGNGRMPALLARQIGISVERVRSSTAETGNLGSASLPAAWASVAGKPPGPIIWTAAGAGLISGAALLNKTT
jgi:3-oxoacyl-[acyl-carrier-protein] synthase-3